MLSVSYSYLLGNNCVIILNCVIAAWHSTCIMVKFFLLYVAVSFHLVNLYMHTNCDGYHDPP